MVCEVKAENLQQQDFSIIAIGPTQTNNNTRCTDSDAILATPGIAFFQTEYASAKNQEGNLVTVVVSYDSMSSLSVGSKLEVLNHNPNQMTTPPLPIKTLYSVTEKSYEVYHLKLRNLVNKGKQINETIEIYNDNSYNLYPPLPVPK